MGIVDGVLWALEVVVLTIAGAVLLGCGLVLEGIADAASWLLRRVK